MLDIISKSIDRFYKKKDYKAFKVACKTTITFFEGLKNHIDFYGLRLEEVYGRQMYPSQTWYIHFHDYKNGELEISYKTILKVSKVAPLFYVQHEFAVKNKDENGLVSYLEGFDNETCIKQQFDLNDEISNVLKKEGYFRLEYSDMNKVVPEFKIPNNMTSLARNVTVEHLLFTDIYDICK